MKLFKYIEFINENSLFDEKPTDSKKEYNPKNIINEICVAMVLINNHFLDKILDQGQRARYTENNHMFIQDLKHLILSKNRLKIGKYVDRKCVEDTDISKLTKVFNDVEFDMVKDWSKLSNSRIIARNIMDKLLPEDKLTSDMIKNVFWLGVNKDRDYNMDIVIETEDGNQYPIYINKNLNLSKSASFNTLADDIIGLETDRLFKGDYMEMWDVLTQNWVRIIYENANNNMQLHIEKFIEPDRIYNLSYFKYLDIKHMDSRYAILGEEIPEFDKNFLYLSDLLKEIWKKREECFSNPDKVYSEWMEKKVLIFNSKILEHIITDSIVRNNMGEITKLDDGYKETSGNIKMKFIKTLVEKLGATETAVYYFGNNGNLFYKLPSRQWFRENYDDLILKFDYHVKMVVNTEDENANDFVIKTNLSLKENKLMDCDIIIDFAGGEMSGRLSAKYKFHMVDDFNMRIK